MSEDEAFRLVHMLSLFVLLAGVGSTMLPLYRTWNSTDVNAQVFAFREAGRNQAGILLPGVVLTGVTGLIWAIRADHLDPVETGWLLTVELIYLVILFVCIPAMAAGCAGRGCSRCSPRRAARLATSYVKRSPTEDPSCSVRCC